MIDSARPEALAAALLEMSKPEVRARLAQRGLRRARLFSWDKMASTLEAFLTDIAEGRAPASETAQ